MLYTLDGFDNVIIQIRNEVKLNVEEFDDM